MCPCSYTSSSPREIAGGKRGSGPPFEIAARKTTGTPTYTFLRRWTDLNPVSAGLLSGAAMSLLVDEGMTPLMGFSAPNRDYPLSTHLRGFVAHLAFGLGVAATAEAIRWLGSNGTGRRWP